MSSGCRQVTGNINSFNVLNSSNVVNLITEADAEGRQILQWLSPLEPQQRHQGVRIDRLDGVGNWLLKPPSSEIGGIKKMVALSQYCSVTGIQGWGKHISGRKASCLEKGNADIIDD